MLLPFLNIQLCLFIYVWALARDIGQIGVTSSLPDFAKLDVRQPGKNVPKVLRFELEPGNCIFDSNISLICGFILILNRAMEHLSNS